MMMRPSGNAPQNILPPARFNTIDAAVAGYRTVFAYTRYIAALAVLPLAVAIAVTLMTINIDEDLSLAVQFMLNLPVYATSGWFMFMLMRLIVLNERIDRPAQNAALSEPFAQSLRQQQMRASVVTWILFNLALTAIAGYLLWMSAQLSDKNMTAEALQALKAQLMVPNMLLVGACLWGVRLGVLHLLAAVGYPLSAYMKRARGVGISVRLIALGLVTLMPVALMQQAVIEPVVRGDVDIAKMSFVEQAVFVAATQTLSMLGTALLTAAAAAALKQMLGGEAKVA